MIVASRGLQLNLADDVEDSDESTAVLGKRQTWVCASNMLRVSDVLTVVQFIGTMPTEDPNGAKVAVETVKLLRVGFIARRMLFIILIRMPGDKEAR